MINNIKDNIALVWMDVVIKVRMLTAQWFLWQSSQLITSSFSSACRARGRRDPRRTETLCGTPGVHGVNAPGPVEEAPHTPSEDASVPSKSHTCCTYRGVSTAWSTCHFGLYCSKCCRLRVPGVFVIGRRESSSNTIGDTHATFVIIISTSKSHLMWPRMEFKVMILTNETKVHLLNVNFLLVKPIKSNICCDHSSELV